MSVKDITLLVIGLTAGVLAGGGIYASYAAASWNRSSAAGAIAAQQSPSADHEEAHEDDPDEHDGHEHDEEHEAGVVHLTAEKLARLHLESVAIRQGTLTSAIELPGQVEWNTDRVVHVTPRVAGVVLAVEKTLGQRVAVGDMLCVLDSREMGSAKMKYLADLSRFEVSQADVERARTIFANTNKLLSILEADATPQEALAQAHDLEIGRNKSRLLTAYTAMHVTQRTAARAQTLFEKGVGTEQDLLEAQGAHETARADYVSTREEIAFNLRPDLLRAERDFEVARTEVRNSERALHILGLTNEQTAELATRSATIDEDIARSVLYSPIDGVIVERHLTRGEQVDTDSRLYTIANLTDVWVMGRVYERDIRLLEKGQKAIVRLDAFPDELVEGVVDYIGSHLDPATRTIEARVVLPNAEGRFRPGMFATVTVFAEPAEKTFGLLVPLAAVQRVTDGHAVYEVIGDGEFRQVPVQIVAKSKTYAEIAGELPSDARVAVGDTFVLKSEAGREEMGSGHSH